MESRKRLSPSKAKRELLDEQSPGLLKELHLLTRDGHLNADARRKLKQVNHLYTLVRPALDDILERHPDATIVDVGAGKAYLGFIIYEMALKDGTSGRIVSVETREELVKKGRETAKRLGFDRMEFVHAPMETLTKAEGPADLGRVHLVTALHACDTATDDALIFGVKSKADYIACVPCCQAEVAELLKKEKDGAYSELWRHGIHRREFGSHVTNVIRALALETLGYSVTVTELVGWEHSLKNEFILAKRVQNENNAARKKLMELVEQIHVKPKIVRELF